MARRLSQPDLPLLAEHLGRLRAQWTDLRLDSDPLAFPHRYEDRDDREVVAFLAASLAFGRVASIQASVARVLSALGPSPARFLEGWDGEGLAGLEGSVHRWVTAEDLTALLRGVSVARRAHGSLEALFASGDPGGDDFVPALDAFYERLRAATGRPGPLSRGLGFLLPRPADGSACKRAHLFLRWMVRRDGFDLGLWRGGLFFASRLLLPMDTHVHRISTYLGLTRRKNADLLAAREATSWLRRISPRDPVAFDWALSRLGILAECVRERSRRHCERCAVRPVCRVSLLQAPSREAGREALTA